MERFALRREGAAMTPYCDKKFTEQTPGQALECLSLSFLKGISAASETFSNLGDATIGSLFSAVAYLILFLLAVFVILAVSYYLLLSILSSIPEIFWKLAAYYIGILMTICAIMFFASINFSIVMMCFAMAYEAYSEGRPVMYGVGLSLSLASILATVVIWMSWWKGRTQRRAASAEAHQRISRG